MYLAGSTVDNWYPVVYKWDGDSWSLIVDAHDVGLISPVGDPQSIVIKDGSLHMSIIVWYDDVEVGYTITDLNTNETTLNSISWYDIVVPDALQYNWGHLETDGDAIFTSVARGSWLIYAIGMLRPAPSPTPLFTGRLLVMMT
jgi:hypothetical protein